MSQSNCKIRIFVEKVSLIKGSENSVEGIIENRISHVDNLLIILLLDSWYIFNYLLNRAEES